MSMEERENLLDRLRAALRVAPGDGGDLAMTAALRHLHPADVAEAMEDLTRPEALAVFNWLDNATAAEVLDEIDQELVRYILDNAPPGRIADLLDRLPMDDAAEIVSEATPSQAEEILENLQTRSPEDAAEVRELLGYEDGTAGRLMTDKFVRLGATMSVEEAFAALRRADKDVETLTTLYVVEGRGNAEKLAGVISLRDLVRASPRASLSQIMTGEPITVTVDTDQEEAARLISKYDFSALPVLDRNGFLAGIVTIDDVVDVLLEEQTEDTLRQAAVATDTETASLPYFAVPIWRSVQRRVGWLALLFAAGTLTAGVIGHFEGELKRESQLMIFLTLLAGTGGNTGAQTVSTVIRALSLGEIRGRDTWRVLLREMGSGILLGLILCAVAFVFAWWRTGRADIALVVSLTIIAVCLWSNCMGALVPLAARQLKVDPALASAPLITTLVDATGVGIYLLIARALLKSLQV